MGKLALIEAFVMAFFIVVVAIISVIFGIALPRNQVETYYWANRAVERRKELIKALHILEELNDAAKSGLVSRVTGYNKEVSSIHKDNQSAVLGIFINNKVDEVETIDLSDFFP